MASCLGLYIEENLIKYAKISKNHDNTKVETFGIKFYDQIGEAIKQVIEETSSQKVPISVNLLEEMYNYFNMFSLLSKNDLQKAIKTEFESFCSDKGYNPNVFETKYAVVENKDDKQKLRVIHISANKIEMDKRIQLLNSYKIASLSPLAMTIPNLISQDINNTNGNSIIVNIEEKTEVTIIIDNKIYDVETIDEGSSDILTKISEKENSYSKAYEICKNTTIYTSEGNTTQEDEQEVLAQIMPTLYTIVGKIKNIMNTYAEKFDKVYISGTSAMINNIDLYFQEYLPDSECEILKPNFIENTKDLSIKDYQEVNTAISLALMGLGDGISGMNFKPKALIEGVPEWLKIDFKKEPKSSDKSKINIGDFLKNDLGQSLNKTEVSILRFAIALFLLVVIYSVFTALLNSQMEAKKDETSSLTNDINSQISLANSDNDKIKSRTNEYTQMIKNLEEINDKITDRNKTRNAIPDLLNQLMYIIPADVQITSIENTTGTHIVINAQSDKYEQLGYFKAKIKSDVILTNVVSTAGQKENNVVTVKIEGELP